MIFHLDLDSFYCSAERLRRPDLLGVPLAVGGRGVIASASYEARKFGVRSAMPTAQALRICPGLALVPPDFSWYVPLSRKVFEIVSGFSPTVEKVSIDEAYIDMRGTTGLHGDPRAAAEKMRQAIRQRTGLAASVGIGSHRRLAKIASDFAKPDGIFLVEPGREREFLGPLEIRRVPGIGKSTEESLNREGIYRIRDLEGWDDARLVRRFGENFGAWLSEIRDGRGSTEFFEEPKTRSISREETFSEPLKTVTELKKALWELVSDLGQELRAEGSDEGEKVYGRTVRLKLRYPDFETITRSRVLQVPTRTDRDILEMAERMLIENWQTSRPIRLLGVGVVLGSGAFQQELFSQARSDRAEKMDELRDSLRAKFGESAARTGRDLQSRSAGEGARSKKEKGPGR